MFVIHEQLRIGVRYSYKKRNRSEAPGPRIFVLTILENWFAPYQRTSLIISTRIRSWIRVHVPVTRKLFSSLLLPRNKGRERGRRVTPNSDTTRRGVNRLSCCTSRDVKIERDGKYSRSRSPKEDAAQIKNMPRSSDRVSFGTTPTTW